MFEIPKNRKRINVGRLCLLLGLTVLLYMVVAHEFSQATQALVSTAKP